MLWKVELLVWGCLLKQRFTDNPIARTYTIISVSVWQILVYIAKSALDTPRKQMSHKTYNKRNKLGIKHWL